MNEHDSFEQRLRRQPLRQVPSSWREEVLSQARRTAEESHADRATIGKIGCGTAVTELAKRLGVRQPSAALTAALEKRQRAAAVQNAGAPSEGLLAGWRLLFARLPLAWASLAALWIALIGVNLMLPSPMVRMAEPGAPSAEMELLASWDFQPAGVEPSDDLGTPASRALPATKQQEVPIRPRSERRRGVDVGETQPDSSFDFIA